MQERIVAELDKINEVIEECRELLRTLDSLAQSIFYDTFGDPISNPKGWPIRQISEIGEIERGTGISKRILLQMEALVFIMANYILHLVQLPINI